MSDCWESIPCIDMVNPSMGVLSPEQNLLLKTTLPIIWVHYLHNCIFQAVVQLENLNDCVTLLDLIATRSVTLIMGGCYKKISKPPPKKS